MCKVIAISCNKGGVGKTTSAINIGIGLANYGKKALLMDVDGQGDLSKSLGIENPETLDYTMASGISLRSITAVRPSSSWCLSMSLMSSARLQDCL